ncbi:MerR family DNA-binding transcriptional regulator, partial [Vibrio parahaemolyticus]
MTCLLLYSSYYPNTKNTWVKSHMYLISELAAKAGISRTTLLYYEKLGLINGQRLDNGYRYYSE